MPNDNNDNARPSIEETTAEVYRLLKPHDETERAKIIEAVAVLCGCDLFG